MSWQDRAACLNESPDLFFPLGSAGASLPQINQAKYVCAGCTVRPECLEWAVRVGVDHGVWGGLTEEERRSLKYRAARA